MAQRESDDVADLLKDLLIVQLSAAGVGQLDIRKIVGCDIAKVNRIAKLLKRAAKKKEKEKKRAAD